MRTYARAGAKEAARREFEGLWAATTTPFDAAGRPDTDALGADLERLVQDLEVDGVFCTGVMSEFWALSVEERRTQVEAVVSATRGRCPVIAHTGHHSLSESLLLTRHAENVGADYAVVIRPYFPQAGEEGIYDFYARLCAGVDIGVWIFDTGYAGDPLSLDLLDRLADIENVCGMKLGHSHAHFLKVLGRVGDRVVVSEPNEGAWLSNMRDHGLRVFMSSAAPYLYQTPSWRPMREYTRAAMAGDHRKAAEIAATLDPVREIADRWLHGRWHREGVHPVPMIKAWSSLLGMAGGAVRPPLSDPEPAAVAALEAALDGAGLLR
jgi:4-hydroxy-tetrahydrodipicolinate synthase